uniref:Adaptin ear-binding coat-associated protein 2 (Trinotate prediction) n=1 Tax=Henneguya salminicola TaxID=69463 RepID=A0A6G3MHM3_HENSL
MIESTDRTLLIKKDVCIYKIPPMRNSYGHKAADWNVNQPSFTGLLRIIGCEKVVKLRMEDQNDGKLFAEAIVSQYPGPCVLPTTDSSRYFAIKISNENGRL